MPTALLSVYDKSGVVELATALHDLGWSLVSSGGTAAAIAATGVPVTDVADLTGFPAILGHRVVTLHPKVHGGILADLDDEAHRADLAEYGIEPISLVVVNLYPFASDPGIELIDIGGPALVRAAAKNHAHVGVVVDPRDYEPVVAEIRQHGGLTDATRRRLARDAFARTAAYDAAIVTWFDASDPAPDVLPRTLAPRPRAGATVAVRREPPPAGSPLSRGRSHRVVGRDDAARRQGAQLPQPLRHRGGLAPRPSLRRHGVRDRQARQPVRGGDR